MDESLGSTQMNHDDIIRMARESGHGVQLDDGGRWGWMWNTNLKMMTDFANLVAAAERNRETALLRQAFEALDWGGGTYEKRCDAIAALQERLRETP